MNFGNVELYQFWQRFPHLMHIKFYPSVMLCFFYSDLSKEKLENIQVAGDEINGSPRPNFNCFYCKLKQTVALAGSIFKVTIFIALSSL